jgi:serine/threonine protein kinase
LFELLINYILFIYVDNVEEILPHGGSGSFLYRVKEKKTKEIFVIKQTPIPTDFSKEKFEELISGWKKTLNICFHIVYYYDHWYENNYVFTVMEYCSKGDVEKEIEKRIKNKEKFNEKVYLFIFI